jgi:hypothetical protein
MDTKIKRKRKVEITPEEQKKIEEEIQIKKDKVEIPKAVAALLKLRENGTSSTIESDAAALLKLREIGGRSRKSKTGCRSRKSKTGGRSRKSSRKSKKL